MVDMSDETKLQAIKDEMNNLALTAKLSLIINETIEIYRQYVKDELPSLEIAEEVASENFKERFSLAVLAAQENMQNIFLFCRNMGEILSVDYMKNILGNLPNTSEEYVEFTKLLQEEVDKEVGK